MKRPDHIDGITRICCGNRGEQCEDCPMKEWAAKVEREAPPLVLPPVEVDP